MSKEEYSISYQECWDLGVHLLDKDDFGNCILCGEANVDNIDFTEPDLGDTEEDNNG